MISAEGTLCKTFRKSPTDGVRPPPSLISLPASTNRLAYLVLDWSTALSLQGRARPPRQHCMSAFTSASTTDPTYISALASESIHISALTIPDPVTSASSLAIPHGVKSWVFMIAIATSVKVKVDTVSQA